MDAYAITHTAHAHCELQTCEAPAPGDRQIAGATLVSLVSPGTELNAAYCGQRFPRSSGYAAIFRVDAIGSGVEGVAIGDHYFCSGSHRSWQCCALEQAVPVPTGLAPEVAVLARLMGVSHTSLITTKARPGQRVLITGLGPVGYLAACQCRIAGFEVLACDPIAERRAMAEAAGIATALGPPDNHEAALALECAGHEDAVIACCKAVRRCGEVVMIGVPWQQRSQAAAHDLLHVVFHNYVYLRSGWEWEVPRTRQHFADSHSIRDSYVTALRWLAEGRIPLPDQLIGICDPIACNDVYHGHLKRSIDHICSVFNWATFDAVAFTAQTTATAQI